MERVNPLLGNITWGQRAGYNALVPYDCPESSGGKAPVGCVATAMGQVMKKWGRSNSDFNWNAMPANTGSMETARLMRDLGNMLEMKYCCAGSSVGIYTNKYMFENPIKNVFNFYGYYATYGSYDFEKVVNDLKKGYPVLLGGFTDRSCFLGIFCWGSGDGHEWIADGYVYWIEPQATLVYNRMLDRWVYRDRYSYMIRMNWGWDGLNNGWFLSDSWDRGYDDNGNLTNIVVANNFQYCTDVVIDIH